MKSKQRASAKPKRKPSKLETQLRLSIKFAKLEARINALEAEVLAIRRSSLFTYTGSRGLEHEMRPEFS